MNTSPRTEDTQLLGMFRAHFGGFLNLARIRLVCHFITALCKARTVNCSKLLAGFDAGADTQSNYRRYHIQIRNNFKVYCPRK